MVLKTGGASPLLLKKVVLQLSLKIIHRVPSYRVGQASDLAYKARSPAQHLSFSKVPAVVNYCNPVTTQKMGYDRLSRRVNKTDIEIQNSYLIDSRDIKCRRIIEILLEINIL
jgi:hypothetical protein